MNVDASADRLMRAWALSEWVTSADEMPSPKSGAEVYQLHEALTRHALATSALGGLAGYKQGGIGVIEGEPCVYGILFKSGLVQSGSSLSQSKHNLFGVEPEIGFMMGSTLEPMATTRSEAEVFAAVEAIVPVIEVCGRRHKIESVTPLQSLGDASCAACVVLGQFIPVDKDGPTPADLCGWMAKLHVNCAAVSSGGATANPLGSPVASLAWCANHLNARGISLRAGDIVIGGAMCKSRDFSAGDEIAADFSLADGSAIATVSVRISD
eukprot:m.461815 g.461815  ORF g.461815 m.461815 type:complete len:268 (+) comp22416_c0_seq1:1743-2546(+)